MADLQYKPEQVVWLKERWHCDIIDQIVIALNEGRDINDILQNLPQKRSIPPVPDRLDLRGIDLSHQNLRGPWKVIKGKHVRSGVNLQRADLTVANLGWTILPRADLRSAILIHADMNHAELIYTDLSGADLTGANLKGVWLLDTKLQRAIIEKKQLAVRRNLGQLDFDYLAYER